MAANYVETRVYPAECQFLINQLGSPQFYTTQKLTYVGAVPIQSGCTLSFRHGFNLASYGETVRVTLLATGPATTQITIHSECDMPTQIIDWGQNKKNVHMIFQHLEMYILPSFANQGQLFQCPNCHNTFNGPTTYCPVCGYRF